MPTALVDSEAAAALEESGEMWMPLSTRLSRPLANPASICAVESASPMTTRATAVPPAPRARSHKTEAQLATELPAEASARLGRLCATAPVSMVPPPLVPAARPERMLAMVSAWRATTSPAVARRARPVQSRPGHRGPPATAPNARSSVALDSTFAAAHARATTAHQLVAPLAQRAHRIRTERQPAWRALARSTATPATTTAALRANA